MSLDKLFKLILPNIGKVISDILTFVEVKLQYQFKKEQKRKCKYLWLRIPLIGMHL